MILLAAHDHDVTGFGWLEWIGVGLAGIFVAWVIYRAVVLTARPGEDDPQHIKRTILEDDAPTGTSTSPNADEGE